MSERTIYTTAQVRADDIRHGDVIRVNGNWVFVYERYDWNTADATVIREEVSHLPNGEDLVKQIIDVVNVTSEAVSYESTFVAVRYLSAAITGFGSCADPSDPRMCVTAYSMYDLVTVQVPERKASA